MDPLTPEEKELARLQSKILKTLSRMELQRYLYLRANISDIILKHAGKIAEERMKQIFPINRKSNKEQAVKMARNRRRYKPPLTLNQIANQFGVTELYLRKNLGKKK